MQHSSISSRNVFTYCTALGQTRRHPPLVSLVSGPADPALLIFRQLPPVHNAINIQIRLQKVLNQRVNIVISNWHDNDNGESSGYLSGDTVKIWLNNRVTESNLHRIFVRSPWKQILWGTFLDPSRSIPGLYFLFDAFYGLISHLSLLVKMILQTWCSCSQVKLR